MTNVLPLRGTTRPTDGPTDAPDSGDRDPGTLLPMTASHAVYTVREVASLLKLSLGSTYQLVRAGDIPALKLGNRWVIPKRRFHSWLDNLPEG